MTKNKTYNEDGEEIPNKNNLVMNSKESYELYLKLWSMAVQASVQVSGGSAICVGIGMFSPNSLTESLAKGIP